MDPTRRRWFSKSVIRFLSGAILSGFAAVAISADRTTPQVPKTPVQQGYYPDNAGMNAPVVVPDTNRRNEPATPSADVCEGARADWQVLENTQSRAALQAFMRKYADCPIYVAAAQDRMTTISTAPPTPTVVTPPVTQPVTQPEYGGDICSQLWYERNLIFHNNGYCFQTARAKAVFNTSQCTGRSPNLSAAEQREVARIQSLERANGC